MTRDAAHIHVAVLREPWAGHVLSGRKPVESRLSLNRVTPFNKVKQGERIYFKRAAGGFFATATAARIDTFGRLNRLDLTRLQIRYDPFVLGGDDYWHAKRRSRYATFIWLGDVEPVDLGPAIPPLGRRAWLVLPASRCVYQRASAERLFTASR